MLIVWGTWLTAYQCLPACCAGSWTQCRVLPLVCGLESAYPIPPPWARGSWRPGAISELHSELLGTCSVPNTGLSVADTAINEKDMVPD